MRHVACGMWCSSIICIRDIYIYEYIFLVYYTICAVIYQASSQLTVAVESFMRHTGKYTNSHTHTLAPTWKKVKHSKVVWKKLKPLHFTNVAIKSLSKCVAIIKRLLVHMSVVAHALRIALTTCNTFHSIFKVSSCRAIPSILFILEFPAFFWCGYFLSHFLHIYLPAIYFNFLRHSIYHSQSEKKHSIRFNDACAFTSF